MGIITNIITLLSVIYAVGCTSFLATNSPQQYYNTAYVSVAVMMFILLLRFIYIKIRSLNNDCKKTKSSIQLCIQCIILLDYLN